MADNRYYYYNHETCSFVEVEPQRSLPYTQGVALLAVSLVMAGLMTWVMDLQFVQTPQEASLQAENKALQQQISSAGARMDTLTRELKALSRNDQNLYRTLLQADPISEDVRQVGVGGTDPYEKFDRFEGEVSGLMRQTAKKLDQLERKMKLESVSYQKLSQLAERRQQELKQLPALLPADGPVVSGYGVRRHPILNVPKMHDGLDVLVESGSPIMAPADGVVKSVVYTSGYGNLLQVRHPKSGYTTRYAHLSDVPDHIKRGAKVKRGETIAFSGNTGRSTGPHLHYEVRDQNGKTVNPVYFFAPSMTPRQYRKLLKEAQKPGVSLD